MTAATPHARAWTLIEASSLAVSPWRNGRGVSRTIAEHRGPDGELLWQVGIADLVQDGPFSHYPHMDRVFTPIAGDPPPQLAFRGGAFEPCPLLVPKPFPGDVPTLSRIPAPGQALNAIVDRRRHRASVTVLHLAAGDTVSLPDAPVLVLHCLRGRMDAAGAAALAGDSLMGGAPAAPVMMALPGVVVVIAIHGQN